MAEQLSLMGLEAPVRPTDRLFLGIFPGAETATGIGRLARNLRTDEGLRGQPLADDRYHVTLHHLGDYDGLPQDVVRAAAEAASALALAPFDVTFDRAASFAGKPRNRPFVLQGGTGVIALIAFQQALGLQLAKAGLGRWAKPQFTPHVTLLYDDRLVVERPVQPVTWTVQKFVLIHSLLGRTEHITLRTWELRG